MFNIPGNKLNNISLQVDTDLTFFGLVKNNVNFSTFLIAICSVIQFYLHVFSKVYRHFVFQL